MLNKLVTYKITSKVCSSLEERSQGLQKLRDTNKNINLGNN